MSAGDMKVWFQLHSTIMLANQVSSRVTAIGLPFPPGAAQAAKDALRTALAVAEGTSVDDPLIQVIARAILHDLDQIILEQTL